MTRAAPRILLSRGSAVLAVCALGYLVAAALVSGTQGVWSLDSALRVVQVESLLRNDRLDLSLPYPAASVDPEGRYFPATDWFHYQENGRHYFLYLPYFAVLVAPFYRLLGFPGLLVLPLLAGLSAVWVTYRVLAQRAPSMAIPGTLALAVGSPLLIYSASFWDHSLAAALGTGALAAAVKGLEAPGRGRPWPAHIVAGALLGAGMWFRSEMYLLAAIVIVLWPLFALRERVKSTAGLLAGFLATAIPLWLLNANLYGMILGRKAQGHVAFKAQQSLSAIGTGWWSWVTYRLGNIYYHLLSPDFYGFNPRGVAIGLILAGAFLGAVVVLRVGLHRRSHSLVEWAGALVLVVTLVMLSSHTLVSGLLPAAPFLAFVILARPRTRAGWFLGAVAGVFTAAVVMTASHGGIQWGPRYLLPVLPALAWLAADAFRSAADSAPQLGRAVRRALAAWVLAGILVQAAGVDHVAAIAHTNVQVKTALRAAPAKIVVTPFEWLVLEAGEVYFEKALMLVRNREDLRNLVLGLAARQVGRWSYIPQSGADFTPSAVEEFTPQGPWRFRLVDDRTVEGLRLVTFEGSPVPAASEP